MNELNELKFITEDKNEYIILKNKIIENEIYGYAVNINDELDSMFVKIINDNDSISFEIIYDNNIINEILK